MTWFQALFPDNTYGVDSGGDPTVIPQLSWENFSGFHRKFYHPSNARVYFYGDDDVTARLELLDQYLGEFDPLPTARQESVIQWQKKRTEPWTLEQKVAGGADAKTIFTLNWLINDQKLDGQVRAFEIDHGTHPIVALRY